LKRTNEKKEKMLIRRCFETNEKDKRTKHFINYFFIKNNKPDKIKNDFFSAATTPITNNKIKLTLLVLSSVFVFILNP